ncbi:MAG TPA: hypothetical protein PKH33_10665, partial [bacterium]|nr:hypothetical protein [bacterium]
HHHGFHLKPLSSFWGEAQKEEKFRPNEDKMRLCGPRKSCIITGLTKNASEPIFGIGRKKKKQIRSAMHNLVVKKQIYDKYNTNESIEGWLNYLNIVDNKSHKQMANYWKKLKADR